MILLTTIGREGNETAVKQDVSRDSVFAYERTANAVQEPWGRLQVEEYPTIRADVGMGCGAVATAAPRAGELATCRRESHRPFARRHLPISEHHRPFGRTVGRQGGSATNQEHGQHELFHGSSVSPCGPVSQAGQVASG